MVPRSMNKYFLTTEGMLGQNIHLLRDLVRQIHVRGISPARQSYRPLADITSFHGFLSLIILQDVLTTVFGNWTKFHIFGPTYRIQFCTRGYSFVLNEVKKFSFVDHRFEFNNLFTLN